MGDLKTESIPPVTLRFTTSGCATWPTDELQILRQDARLARLLKFARAPEDILERRTGRVAKIELRELFTREDATPQLRTDAAGLVTEGIFTPTRLMSVDLQGVGLNKGTLRILEGKPWLPAASEETKGAAKAEKPKITREGKQVLSDARHVALMRLLKDHGGDWKQPKYAEAVGVSARTIREDKIFCQGLRAARRERRMSKRGEI